MIVLSLDLATRTGWAIGKAGEPPKSGGLRLKKPDESAERAAVNLGYFLRNILVMKIGKPDLVAYEAPLDPAAVYSGRANAGVRPQNSASISMPWMLVGVVELMCDFYAVETLKVNRQSCLKLFTGRSRWGSRPEAKKQVLERAKLLGLIPADCKDDDRADAVAVHHFASVTRARVAPAELVMFQPGAVS